DVYRPLVERLAERRFFPFTLHISGPLLEWLEAHDPAYLDLIGRLAADGQVELLLAGFYEPVLASLLPTDRVEQVAWMGEAIRRRFGVTATGLWLTERVWEPDLAARRLAVLEQELGEARMAGPEGALVRGAHWRNFLVKYAEANRMHKKMLALSGLCRERGDPPAARRAIGRAQCNDAYWHGVFGGLYLPHLRNAIWRNLALAEA